MLRLRAQRIPFLINSSACNSLHSRCEERRLLMFVQWKHTADGWLIMARSRLHTEFLSLDSPQLGRLLTWRNPLGWYLRILGGCIDFVVARADTIHAIAGIDFLAIGLPNEFYLRILFVTVNVVVRWDRWWVGEQGVRRLFVPRAALAVLLLTPLTALVVLARSWVAC